MLLATSAALPANEVGIVVLLLGLAVTLAWLLRLYR